MQVVTRMMTPSWPLHLQWLVHRAKIIYRERGAEFAILRLFGIEGWPSRTAAYG